MHVKTDPNEPLVLRFDILKSFEFPHCRAHCADSVVVITRRCQRLNPGSSPGRRIHLRFVFFSVLRFLNRKVSLPLSIHGFPVSTNNEYEGGSR